MNSPVPQSLLRKTERCHSGRMNSQPDSNTVTPSDVVTAPVATVETLTYSVSEAARVLGVSWATIYRLIARRILKPLPGLRHKRLPKRQIMAYLNSAQSL